jgi:hypothetical protein
MQDVDGKDAAQQLRPQHARSSTVRRIGIVDDVFCVGRRNHELVRRFRRRQRDLARVAAVSRWAQTGRDDDAKNWRRRLGGRSRPDVKSVASVDPVVDPVRG